MVVQAAACLYPAAHPLAARVVPCLSALVRLQLLVLYPLLAAWLLTLAKLVGFLLALAVLLLLLLLQAVRWLSPAALLPLVWAAPCSCWAARAS